MEITEGVNLEVPGHPLAPPLGSEGTPAKGGPTAATIGDYWREAAGSVLGPRRGESPGPQRGAEAATAAAELARRDFSLGRGLSITAALGSHRCSSPRVGGLGGSPVPSGTCLPGALPRGPAPAPPGRQLSSRRPGNRHRLLSVTWVGAANHGRGGRGAHWEERRELWECRRRLSWGGSEAKLPLGVAGCVSVSRVRPSTTAVRSSPAGGPGSVPSSGDEPEQAQALPSGAGCVTGKTEPAREDPLSVFAEKDGIRDFHFTGVTRDHLRTCRPRSA